MTPEELREFVSDQLVRDFQKKVLQDTGDVIARNVETFFGKTVPGGLGHFMALVSLAGVMNATVEACIDSETLTEESADELVVHLSRMIRKF